MDKKTAVFLFPNFLVMNSSIIRATMFAVLVSLLIYGGVAFADHSSEPLPAADIPATTQAETAPSQSASESYSPACAITENLTLGSRGESVECLQSVLINGGLLATSATGFFGERTKAAVAQWQKARGIPATGFFGQMSREIFAIQNPIDAAEEVTESAHVHEPLDVASWPAIPSVSIVLHPDSMAGYNLEIKPVNFGFAPENVNGTVRPNEGHTHLLINGKKAARVYGNWFHIGPDMLAEGANEITVTLNANDHSDLEYLGVRIEAKSSVMK